MAIVLGSTFLMSFSSQYSAQSQQTITSADVSISTLSVPIVYSALSDVFRSYARILNANHSDDDDNHGTVYDSYSSKREVWSRALSLALLLAQTDSIIVNTHVQQNDVSIDNSLLL